MKYKRERKIALGLFLFIIFFVFVSKTSAKESELVKINELCSDPLKGEVEWIELYNSSSESINLDNFSIEDGTNKPKKLSGAIEAGSYIVLKKGEDFSFGLNNSGDILVLKKDDDIIDKVSYGNYDDGDRDDNASVPDKGGSISRIPNGEDSGLDSADFCKVAPTPGKKNILPIYSKEVIINEIVSAPDNGADNEYIELFNSGDDVIDLSGWQLDDIEGGSSAYTFPKNIKIMPDAYVAFYKSETGIALNDSGDSARLINPNGDLVSSISYEKAIRSQSYSRFIDGWSWSLSLTPNKKNTLTVPTIELKDRSVISIIQARGLLKGDKARVRGRVTALPGDISRSYFYIEDDTGGIQIYNYYKNFPDMRYGDLIEIFGEISEISTELRIKSESITVLESGDKIIPMTVEIKEIDEKLEGQVVVLFGEVVKPSGNTFYLRHNGAEIKVQVKNKKVNKPRLKSGYLVEVRGVVSEYKGEYRVLLYGENSVKILQSDELPRAGVRIETIILLYIVAWISFLIVRKKQKFLQKSLHPS